MKNITKYLFVTLLVTFVLCGCATTSWQDTAGKTLVTVAQTVDGAMKGWEAYSVNSGIPDNDPQELQVKLLYGRYQNAFSGALAAYNTAVLTKDQNGWIQASAALSASEGNLIKLVSQLQGKATP